MKRPPDWLLYLGAAGLILAAAGLRREHVDSPAPPPPMPGEEALPLGPASPFSPAGVVRAPRNPHGRSGTAFSVGDQGLWLTAGHVVENCPRVVLLVSEGRGVATQVRLDKDADLAVLTTAGGAPALPLADAHSLKVAARGFHPGFPQGEAGEATSRYLGPETLPAHRRGEADQNVLAWAEAGRTDGLNGALDGLSGAPVIDAAGRVVGVTLSQAPRRGRLYAASPQAIVKALNTAHATPGAGAGETVTVENYGRVADSLRRTLSVARVLCLTA